MTERWKLVEHHLNFNGSLSITLDGISIADVFAYGRAYLGNTGPEWVIQQAHHIVDVMNAADSGTREAAS